MPAVIVAPARSLAPRRKFVIAPGLPVQRLFRGRILERSVLHRELAELLVQAIERPAVNLHHGRKRSLLHAAGFPIADGFHPYTVHLVRALIAAAEFLLEVFEELPVAVTVTRRAVVEERVVDKVFRAVGVVRVVLVRHPVRMAFRKPARMAVVAHPARHSLQAVRKLVRCTPVILQRAHANPHTGPVFAIQALHVVLPAVERRHHGVVEHVDVALELPIGATREREHPSERIDVEREHLLERLKHALRIRRRDRHVVRLPVIRLGLLADLKMLRFGNQRKAVACALVYPLDGRGVRNHPCHGNPNQHPVQFHCVLQLIPHKNSDTPASATSEFILFCAKKEGLRNIPSPKACKIRAETTGCAPVS